MSGEIKIIKTGSGASSPPKPVAKTRKQAQGKPKFGILKGGKTARSGPRFKAVKDPAKSPPVKQAKASTLRILTEKGLTRRRKTIKKLVDDMPISTLKGTLKRSGLPLSDKTPDSLVREIAAGGMEAGMIPV